MSHDWSEVERAVAGAERFGTVGAWLVAPDGEAWVHEGHRRFKAASVVKIPLMIEVYRRVERGELRLDELHVLAASDKAAGSGVLLHLHPGLTLTIEDLVYLTMSISDNSATNILIRRVGMDRVNATMQGLGMTESTLGREMKGRVAEPGEAENWATPGDYVRAVRAILDGEAAGPAGCAAMVAMLERQQNPRRIGRYVPEAEGVRWGSKTGGLKGVTNDVGFVSGPGGRLILAVFCEGMPDLHVGEQCIGEIARAAMHATEVVAPREPLSSVPAPRGRG
jgi:beta-lactamase class A